MICRGNNRAYILGDDKSKSSYLETVQRYRGKYDFKLYCYCLMDNHVHMLVEVGTTPLSQIMKCIQQVYTQKYNKRHNRTGHVFEQRYKASLCNKDQYLLSLINYIHMNPVRAGLADGISYKWSSHGAYLNCGSSLVDIEFPLSLFEGTKEQQLERYMKYMLFEEDHIGKMKPYEFSDDMTDQVKAMLDKKKHHKTVELSPEAIIDMVCKYYKMDEMKLKLKTKRPEIVKAKRVVAILMKRHTKLTHDQVGKILMMSNSAVSLALVDEKIQTVLKLDIDEIGNLVPDPK